MSNEKPVKKFKAGGVEAAVWKNKVKANDESVVSYSVKLARTYKDNDGDWQNTASLRTNDLPKAVVALGKAYEFLVNGSEGDQP